MQELKNCKFCGKQFLAAKKNHIYCCHNCSLKSRQRRDRELYKEEKKEKTRRKKKQNRIAEINEAARAAGMTYGQYVAMQYAKTITIGGKDESEM